MDNNLHSLNNLLETITTLRSENGCPWDQKQTPQSLKKYLHEEVDELIEAINNDDHENISEEIGDVLYVIAMIAEYYRERDAFSFGDCIATIDRKLIRRHPHVFENVTSLSEDELRAQWEKIKKGEKKRNN